MWRVGGDRSSTILSAVSVPIYGVVPNFSEGRRVDVMDAICDALTVPGAHLVYRQADPDHHRLDTTVLGDREAVRRSAVAGARVAVGLIDMDRHHGGHPRMGAVDVIPFMPVRDVSMEECVSLAVDVGETLAGELELPVYLYDRAARTPDRTSLAQVRKGEYEGLREAVRRGERLPDLGPHAIGKAGATAVGARAPLVAFNVYFTGEDEPAAKDDRTDDPRIERGSARRARDRFPRPGARMHDRVDEPRRLRGHRGANRLRCRCRRGDRARLEVTDSEIVGLVPEAALSAEDAAHVKLEGFDRRTQVLERLIEEAS